MSTAKTVGVGEAIGVGIGLIGSGLLYLYPDKRWLGWGFIGAGFLFIFTVSLIALTRYFVLKQISPQHPATAPVPLLPPTNQQLTQTANPHNENVFSPTLILGQSQSQRPVIGERKIETLPSEMEDTDIYPVSAFLSAWGKLTDNKDHAHYECGSAQVDFHLKPLPNSDMWVEVRTQIVFYDEDYHRLKRVKDGVWRTTHPEDTRVNIPFRRGDTKTFVVALDVSGEGLTTYEHNVHDPRQHFVKPFLSPKRASLKLDTVIVQVRLIGEYYQVIRFDEPYWFKVTRFPELKIEKIAPPIFDRANLD
jgi:hypothetical protein